jgi:hypothetical protein
MVHTKAERVEVLISERGERRYFARGRTVRFSIHFW